MDNVRVLPPGSIGRGFIPQRYLPEGEDEFYLRDRQCGRPGSRWRVLRPGEIERLERNNNTCENWNELLVSEEFDPRRIRGSSFFGLVRIGALRDNVLEHHDLTVPAGITNSMIVSSDIGDDAAIHNVSYLAHYIVGSRCILLNIGEMHTTNHAKFGNGVVKEGEPEEIRVWLDLMNETGSRRVLAFDGMIPADAYIWARYRDDGPLMERLKEITQAAFDPRRGYYGTVGDQCVVKDTRILKDVKIGAHCYIKGANKLKNLTINSSGDQPSQIGEGVELVNGIVGPGCHIFYGCKAIRFVLGDNSSLKYGARLINSFLGDNSTISCCEVLNNLIFPAHEQHHNNSFLIASLVMGQSNLAAGATLGSNHNSRANDNETQAGRGFWPGLCSSVKQSCRFASFVLLSKADYPSEMDIPLPFSLVNNNQAKDRLEVIPAFWWMYNMYALERNAWKFRARDNRKNERQHVEFDYLAPDSVEEIWDARRLLEVWTAKAVLRAAGTSGEGPEEEIREAGVRALSGPSDREPEVVGERMEKSCRKVLILKAREAYRAYGDMLHYYAVKNVMEYMRVDPGMTFCSAGRILAGPRVREWVNLGGQIVHSKDADGLRADIRSGALSSWEDIHGRYDALWRKYELDKRMHAYATLCELLGSDEPTAAQWKAALGRAVQIRRFISDQVYISRKKDFENPFRAATYRNGEEMAAAIGTVEQNSFVKQARAETGEFEKLVDEIGERG